MKPKVKAVLVAITATITVLGLIFRNDQTKKLLTGEDGFFGF